MSRIGKKPIIIPDGASVTKDGSRVVVKGPKGELEWKLHSAIDVAIEDKNILVKPVSLTKLKTAAALWGTTRAQIQNMIDGVTRGFEKKLEIEGIGYRALLEGKTLQLSVGFSHPVRIEAPEGIQFKVEKNVITISGTDKILVGETAARVRRVKPPEPYKGKGIRYQGEVVRRKQGKKAVSSA
ncbi:MAG: 50S ribosomal protein L6 [Candidatus Sungbacteria bacterium]|nr:50S ribosomal protein L6 [Candidatus Sungbacteria bacterium]